MCIYLSSGKTVAQCFEHGSLSRSSTASTTVVAAASLRYHLHVQFESRCGVALAKNCSFHSGLLEVLPEKERGGRLEFLGS